MKNPLETLFIPAGILLLAFLSALLLPVPSFGLPLAKSLVIKLHMMDLDQLYTLFFTLWFLLIGTIEYFIIRFLWRRFSASNG